MRIIEVNSRLPDFLRGDLWAGIAAARVGERRLLELVERYGVETFLAALEHFMDYGEQVARRTLAELPKGTFSLAEEQDSGQVYRVTRRRSPTRSSSSTCATTPTRTTGPNNASRDGCLVAAQMVFMNLTESHASANAGHFRRAEGCSRARARSSTPTPHAAFAIYYEVELRLYDLIWRCLAPHLGGRLPAGSFASICGTFIGGPHPDTGAALHDRRAAGRRLGRVRRRATATRRCSAASTATRSTAPPRSPRPATASTSTGWRSTTRRAARASTAAARDRRRVPRPLERLLLHLRLHAEHAQAVGAWRAGSRARRTTPR